MMFSNLSLKYFFLFSFFIIKGSRTLPGKGKPTPSLSVCIYFLIIFCFVYFFNCKNSTFLELKVLILYIIVIIENHYIAHHICVKVTIRWVFQKKCFKLNPSGFRVNFTITLLSGNCPFLPYSVFFPYRFPWKSAVFSSNFSILSWNSSDSYPTPPPKIFHWYP